ncbi:Glycosyltransferase involved in cell wall bisynthesis [Ectothiorhodospira mobilis]|uniref:Glycosyltransferase involved in cell wall bisynthesis n=1 Tax=Ectothiorhodospira mobilis TaxID=195064 RepID=A0A1I4P7F4_ECTMO|nr:Glycosyltransferase involved in cell wall bisynthesis [Ectothiorhodospira mobilis]
MQIAILAHLFPVQSETFVRAHALGMAARGHRVHVVARAPGGDGIPEVKGERMRVSYAGLPSFRGSGLLNPTRMILRYGPWVLPFSRRAPWPPRRMLEAVRYHAAALEDGPDVVHVHFGDLGARMARLGRDRGIAFPDVVTWHGYEATALPSLRGPEMFRALFQSDCLHTVGSAFMRQRLLELGARPEAIRVIPMGVDLQRFSGPREGASGAAPLRILSVGRLVEVKGHCDLLEAIGRLAAAGRRVELGLVGDGPLRETLEAQAAALGITDRVTFVGGLDQDRVIEEMRSADVFALTGVVEASGRAEGQGLVYAEAQAMGLPVIASDVGGVRDSLVDGETGFLCPPRDVGAIATRIAYFDDHREEIPRFGDRGRAFVASRFSREGMLGAFQGLYDQVIAARRAGHPLVPGNPP